MSRYVALCATALLTGCATCEPIEVPVPARVPEACFLPCDYTGPTEIVTNGQLLEAFRGRLDQAACLETRQQCVRTATESARGGS